MWFTPAGDVSARSRFALAAAVAAALGWGALGLFFTRWMHRAVYVAQVLAAALFCIHGIILLASDAASYWLLALALVAIALGDSLWLVRARERLEFVEVFLDVIVASVRRTPLVVAVAVGASVAQGVLFVVWANALCTVLRAGAATFGTYLGLACMFFMLRWWLLVITNVVFITAGGTFAAELVATASAQPGLGAPGARPPSPVDSGTVLHFLWRAVTRSMGTVIVGASAWGTGG